MLKYEFKKLFQSKLFVILFALLLLLNIGLCYRSAKEVAGSVTLEPEILEQMAQEAPQSTFNSQSMHLQYSPYMHSPHNITSLYLLNDFY